MVTLPPSFVLFYSTIQDISQVAKINIRFIFWWNLQIKIPLIIISYYQQHRIWFYNSKVYNEKFAIHFFCTMVKCQARYHPFVLLKSQKLSAEVSQCWMVILWWHHHVVLATRTEHVILVSYCSACIVMYEVPMHCKYCMCQLPLGTIQDK